MFKAGVSPPYSIRNIISKSTRMCNHFLIIFLLFFLIIFPREVLNAARDGLLLWFNNVLPALLPFIVTVNLLTAMGVVRLVSKWAGPAMARAFNLPGAGGFALITGLVAGYPMGAKTVAELWRAKEISAREAQRLLAFCNNAGPLFIVGVVGTGLLMDSAAGYVLWAGHVAAALIVGLLTRGPKPAKSSRAWSNPSTVYASLPDDFNLSQALGEAVRNAMEALILVGGLIIFFSVVVQMIMIFAGGVPYAGLLAGIIEITGGVKALADASAGVVSPGLMAAVGGVIGFGGLSVHAQALHFTSDTGVKAWVYIMHKALNGLVAAGVTGLIWYLYT